MEWGIYFISGTCKNVPSAVWKTSRYSKCLISSNVLNVYLGHTDWDSIYGYSYNSYICSILTNITNCSGWEWSENTVSLKIVYNCNDRPCAFLVCICCVCYKLAMPFLVFFASCCFLLWPKHNRVLLSYKNSLCSQKVFGLFSINTEVTNASGLPFNSKMEEEGWGKSSLQKIRNAQKSAKIGNFFIEKSFFPQHCHCGSVSSRKFTWSDRF